MGGNIRSKLNHFDMGGFLKILEEDHEIIIYLSNGDFDGKTGLATLGQF